MGWVKTSDSEDAGPDTIYDLRQVYAHFILGETLKQIAMARKTENYPLWFHLLKRDLRTEIAQKLKPEELKEINKKVNDTKLVLVKNANTYLGKAKNPQEHEEIEDALCELEMLLTGLMEEHKMYGAKDEDEGLF